MQYFHGTYNTFKLFQVVIKTRSYIPAVTVYIKCIENAELFLFCYAGHTKMKLRRNLLFNPNCKIGRIT